MDELRARVLGGFELDGVDGTRLGSRKARTLLKALALARNRAVTTDQLAEWLWPDTMPAHPVEQIRVLVSRLRGVLGPERLVRHDDGYALRIDWLDLDAMGELVDEACRRLADGRSGSARTAAGAALALARGPLLAEEPDAGWAEADRALADRLTALARRVAAEAAAAAGDLSGAALLAQGALDHDPYDEAVLRTLMSALATSGRPASALRAYAATRARLAEDLGVDPAPETEALHTSILRQPAPAPASATAGAAPERLPGREQALAVLDRALGAARDGSGGLVVVEGEAGIGKTRLLSVWARRARSAGATVLTGRCEEQTRGVPLQPVVAAIEAHLRALAPAEVDRLLEDQPDPVARLLGRRPIADVAPPASTLRDDVGGVLALYAGLFGVLCRLPPPVALLLDDCHLAGPATLEWIHHTAPRLPSSPVVFVCSQRPEEATLPSTAAVTLGPLDEEATVEVVGPDRATALYARSGGHPLFLVELAAAEPGHELPDSLRDAAVARCERAGPAAARTLRTAAVIGPIVDLDLLAAVLPAPPVELLDHLEEGLHRRLLVEQGGRFAFRHELVREALERGTTGPRRALVHREAARALAARGDADPAAVVHHARLGGDDALAASALVDAAAVAVARSHHGEALGLLDESLARRESVEGRVGRARVLITLGEFDRAGEDIDAAGAAGAGAAVLELGAWSAHYRRDFATAVDLADAGARTAETPEQRVACLTIAGWVRQCTGDLRRAAQDLELADDRATGGWKPASRVWLGGLRVHQGRCDEAVALIRPAMLDAAVIVQGHPTLHAHLFSALAYANLGRLEEALEAVAALERDTARTGMLRWAGRADNTRGWILRGLGQEDAADDANAAGLERSAAVAMAEPMAHAHLDLAAGALLRNDPETAAAEVDAAEALGDAHAMAWRHRLRARLYRSEIALARGRLDAAMATASGVVGEAERIGTERYAALGAVALARARLRAGQPVDLAGVEQVLSGLDRVAALESWRMTASLAAAAGVDRWWALAERQAGRLVTAAGAHAPSLQRTVGTTLDRMRTQSRKG